MQPGPGSSPRAGVVIPLRAFVNGKARLATVMDDGERTALARAMADCVVAACGSLPVVVVSSATEVHAWAEARDINVVADVGAGLDAAAHSGAQWFLERGFDRVVVAHADLPRARPGALEPFAAVDTGEVLIVPSHRDDGTPVLSIPLHPPFPFAYGIGSAHRHEQIALDLGLAVRFVIDEELAYDVDLPEDLLP